MYIYLYLYLYLYLCIYLHLYLCIYIHIKLTHQYIHTSTRIWKRGRWAKLTPCEKPECNALSQRIWDRITSFLISFWNLRHYCRSKFSKVHALPKLLHNGKSNDFSEFTGISRGNLSADVDAHKAEEATHEQELDMSANVLGISGNSAGGNTQMSAHYHIFFLMGTVALYRVCSTGLR